MEKVYIVAIIAAAVVILVVAILYRRRLTHASVSVKRDEVTAAMDAQPEQADKDAAAKVRRPTRQRGKTVLDNLLLLWSRIRAPRDADLKIRESKLLHSEINIRDAPTEEDKDND